MDCIALSRRPTGLLFGKLDGLFFLFLLLVSLFLLFELFLFVVALGRGLVVLLLGVALFLLLGYFLLLVILGGCGGGFLLLRLGLCGVGSAHDA